MRSDVSIKSLTKTAMMAAMVFVCIYLVKIPVPNGYTHIGDCMIFLAVLILGTKQGALAGGIGAAFSDLLAGYMYWVFPTFIIKYIMAVLMGLLIERLPKAKWNWLIGAIVGGLTQCVLYTAVDCAMFGLAYGLADIPGMVMQTVVGIVFAGILAKILTKSGVLLRLKEM